MPRRQKRRGYWCVLGEVVKNRLKSFKFVVVFAAAENAAAIILLARG